MEPTAMKAMLYPIRSRDFLTGFVLPNGQAWAGPWESPWRRMARCGQRRWLERELARESHKKIMGGGPEAATHDSGMI
jgi:hypothetical protein